MGIKAYSLRDPYKNLSLGGVISVTHAGDYLDLEDALKKGNGEILTDDVYLQSALESLQGGHGLVFSTADVTEDGKRIPQ